MVSRKRYLPFLSVAVLAAAASSAMASAASYTVTFNDLTYNAGAGYYGQSIPSGYQPSELTGSGIVMTFGDGTAYSAYPFYGADSADPNANPPHAGTPIGQNDATYARTGAGSGASLAGTTVNFNTPVYVTNLALSSYMIGTDGSGTAADIATGRNMVLKGFTNATDATPAISVNVALALHGEAWRATMTWRDTIALQNTALKKLTWSAPGYGEIDDITISTSPGTNLLGDYNKNGVVDDGDYTKWADTYDIWSNPAQVGTSWENGVPWVHGVNLAADANLNGFIDDGDYTAWADTYGQSSVAGAQTAVPEPTSIGLLILGGSALLGRRRK